MSALVIPEQKEAPMHNPSPMQLLQMAVSQGAQIDTIERLAALQKSMRGEEAEQAFNQALNRVQRKLGRISADMENPQTRSKYASYAQIDRKIRPVYTEEGFSLSFSNGEPLAADSIRVLCYVSHEGGHTRTYQKDMPIVTTGAQGKAVMTAIHAHGSADSYGKRYLVKDIFNLAIGEDDTDGNIGNGKMDEKELVSWLDSIKGAGNPADLKTIYSAAYTEANNAGDRNALDDIIAAKNARKAELA
jgi:hypothetical protein